MKLLNVPGCLFPGTGGNVKEQTMIVEEQGIGFGQGFDSPQVHEKDGFNLMGLNPFFVS